jgi:hypothetical protein
MRRISATGRRKYLRLASPAWFHSHVAADGFLTWLGDRRGRLAGAALRGRGFARRFLRITRHRRRFAAQHHGNHRLWFGQQQLALLIAVLIAPFETRLIGFARWERGDLAEAVRDASA